MRVTEPAICAAGLSKSFGHQRVLDRVDLDVDPGVIYGLLGPNGAGKTTLVKILATLLRPDHGSAAVLGNDVVRQAARVRSVIALTGQYAAVDDLISARENLYLIGRLLGQQRRAARARAAELLAAFGLSDAAGVTVKDFSGGMRRRLDLAVSLVGRPAVLFLDEPTTGLDLLSRNDLWDMIRDLASGGTTVLLTTQYLEEADRLASRVMVIDRGVAVAEGTPAELKSRAGGQVLEVQPLRAGDLPAAVAALTGLTGAGRPEVAGDLLTLRLPDEDLVGLAARTLDDARISVRQLAVRLPSLDEAFLAITGHRAAAEPGPVGTSAGAPAGATP